MSIAANVSILQTSLLTCPHSNAVVLEFKVVSLSIMKIMLSLATIPPLATFNHVFC
jgi:hypothetical protein